jgi:hypothetical protein
MLRTDPLDLGSTRLHRRGPALPPADGAKPGRGTGHGHAVSRSPPGREGEGAWQVGSAEWTMDVMTPAVSQRCAPAALEPYHPRVPRPNEPIVLFRGRVDLVCTCRTERDRGGIVPEWLPHPEPQDVGSGRHVRTRR